MQDCPYKGINDYFIGGDASDNFNKWERYTSTNSCDGSAQYIVSAFLTRGEKNDVILTVDGRTMKALVGM